MTSGVEEGFDAVEYCGVGGWAVEGVFEDTGDVSGYGPAWRRGVRVSDGFGFLVGWLGKGCLLGARGWVLNMKAWEM